MKKEDLDFIIELSKELKAQDGGHSKEPYGFLLSQATERIIDDSYGDYTDIVYHREECDLSSFTEILYYIMDEYNWEAVEEYGDKLKEYKEKALEEKPETLEDLEELEIDLTEVGFDKIPVRREHSVKPHDTNFFLTKKAFELHVKVNGHNLEYPKTHHLQLYRNHEMETLLQIIHRIAEEHKND